ncbi:MAG TPA: hypothetical protein VKD08_07775 [Ignavibacteriaceae bacterium]|jgi:hypothetical protein|nr:hypothetical protein [Ignavibacteriaceae bacterium]
MSIGKIGFLETYAPDDNGGIMGAILVTDADTKPLEFRVTAPIKTTNFQKTLYGDVLLEHILVELISVPLINALNEEIDIILVKDNLFLGANNKQGVRVVRVSGDDNSSKAKNGQELKGFSGNGKMFVETSKKYESELGQIKDLLNEVAENRNLLEPFDRLKQACEQVHLQKTSD